MADKDRVKGAAGHPEGTTEEGVGSLKGDEKRQEGTADKAKGKAQSSVHGVEDTGRDAPRGT